MCLMCKESILLMHYPVCVCVCVCVSGATFLLNYIRTNTVNYLEEKRAPK